MAAELKQVLAPCFILHQVTQMGEDCDETYVMLESLVATIRATLRGDARQTDK
jgi:hypothetical protein